MDSIDSIGFSVNDDNKPLEPLDKDKDKGKSIIPLPKLTFYDHIVNAIKTGAGVGSSIGYGFYRNK
jgi:hypothetical protein